MPLPPVANLSQRVHTALEEDLGTGDVTAALIDPETQGLARVISRESAILCGTEWFDEVFRQLDPSIAVSWDASDGDAVEANQRLCRLQGPARGLLSGERTALNFLQTLSGTATRAHQYAKEVEGTRCQILDTRKTVPGLRSAQKYAARCGGCRNHRTGLFDGILIKENHIVAAGGVTAAVRAARDADTGLPVEIEVENLDQVREALAADADILLLDNFSIERLEKAVELNAGQAKLEASGGFALEQIRTTAQTGVDFISVGDITKNVRATDLSMRMRFAAEG